MTLVVDTSSAAVNALDQIPRAEWIEALLAQGSATGEDALAALDLARTFGGSTPMPGLGQTAGRWAILADLGRVNLTAARVFEAHTDALAILCEAGAPAAQGRDAYGVFASEGLGEPLRATTGESFGDFLLTGVKPWCSLGSQLDFGLVTANVDGGRRLFRVDLRDRSVKAEPAAEWVARGLRAVTSTSLHFDQTPATAVGEIGWYLTRAGFNWGGIGVAACWLGGARGLQQRLVESVRSPVGGLSALHLGRVDAALHSADAVLASAAGAIDQGRALGAAGELLALRARAIVADAVELTLREVGHALGPAPLAFDEDHARRVADLELYVRQHHGERDLAALGHASLAPGSRTLAYDD